MSFSIRELVEAAKAKRVFDQRLGCESASWVTSLLGKTEGKRVFDYGSRVRLKVHPGEGTITGVRADPNGIQYRIKWDHPACRIEMYWDADELWLV